MFLQINPFGTLCFIFIALSVPKRWHIKFRRRRVTQKKECNIQNTAKVGNQEKLAYCLKLHGL